MILKMKKDHEDKNHHEIQNNSVFGPVKQEVQKYYDDPEYFYQMINSYKSCEDSKNQIWQYGLKFSMHPQAIMKGIIDTLGELDTTFVVKSPNYRIKCFHKIHRKVTLSNQIEIEKFNQEPAEGDGLEAVQNLKNDKFPTTELIFIIQLYAFPNKIDHIVDIQRTKGHTIVFLEFCHKFTNFLNRNLHKL